MLTTPVRRQHDAAADLPAANLPDAHLPDAHPADANAAATDTDATVHGDGHAAAAPAVCRRNYGQPIYFDSGTTKNVFQGGRFM